MTGSEQRNLLLVGGLALTALAVAASLSAEDISAGAAQAGPPRSQGRDSSGGAAVLAARRLNRAAGMLALSVLADSGDRALSRLVQEQGDVHAAGGREP